MEWLPRSARVGAGMVLVLALVPSIGCNDLKSALSTQAQTDSGSDNPQNPANPGDDDGQPPISFRGRLKVLTLNFSAEEVLGDPDHTIRDRRIQMFTQWVRANEPDIVLFQEAWNYFDSPSVVPLLAAELDYDYAYTLVSGMPFVLADSLGIMTKKKFQLSKPVSIKLPHSAMIIEDENNWVLSLGEGVKALGVKLTSEQGDPIYVYSTHLGNSSDSDRLDQMKALEEHIRARISADGLDPEATRVIIGGDFNSTPDSPAVGYLGSKGYVDTWGLVHSDQSGFTLCSNPATSCFNPMNLGGGRTPAFNDPEPDTRVDQIHVRNMPVISSTVVFTVPTEGLWMSDHYGVVSVLSQTEGRPEGDPNPISDSTGALPETVQVNVTDEMFECWNPVTNYGCHNRMSDFDVPAVRGLTLTNQTFMPVDITVYGDGLVFTAPSVHIDYKQVASFTFATPGKYRVVVRNHNESEIEGIITAK